MKVKAKKHCRTCECSSRPIVRKIKCKKHKLSIGYLITHSGMTERVRVCLNSGCDNEERETV